MGTQEFKVASKSVDRKPTVAEVIARPFREIGDVDKTPYQLAQAMAEARFSTRQTRPGGRVAYTFQDGSVLTFDGAAFWPSF